MRLEYFTAKWCGPCRIFGPMLERTTIMLDVPTEKIDIEESPNKVPEDVMSLPTVIMYQNDKEVSRIIGARSEHDFKSWLFSGGI